VAYLANRALERLGIQPAGATAIVQGFGNVGSYAALTLAERGLKIIGVSDHTACYYDPRGLDMPALQRHAAQNGVLAGFSNQMSFDRASCWRRNATCCAGGDGARDRRRTRRPVAMPRAGRGCHGPTMPEADTVLDQRRGEVFVIPDILCNAGGVVVSYFEWVQDLQQFFWTRRR